VGKPPSSALEELLWSEIKCLILHLTYFKLIFAGKKYHISVFSDLKIKIRTKSKTTFLLKITFFSFSYMTMNNSLEFIKKTHPSPENMVILMPIQLMRLAKRFKLIIYLPKIKRNNKRL
jgi:hypothetical protein